MIRALVVLVLLAVPFVGRADDPFSKMATPQTPPPIDPATQRKAQELQRSVDEAQRDVERRAKEEELLRRGTPVDIERYRVEQERTEEAKETLEDLDRRALERTTKPTPPSEVQATEQKRTQEQEEFEKRTGVVEQKVRVRERRERETPTNPR
jgi:hypothetical protein